MKCSTLCSTKIRTWLFSWWAKSTTETSIFNILALRFDLTLFSWLFISNLIQFLFLFPSSTIFTCSRKRPTNCTTTCRQRSTSTWARKSFRLCLVLWNRWLSRSVRWWTMALRFASLRPWRCRTSSLLLELERLTTLNPDYLLVLLTSFKLFYLNSRSRRSTLKLEIKSRRARFWSNSNRFNSITVMHFF